MERRSFVVRFTWPQGWTQQFVHSACCARHAVAQAALAMMSMRLPYPGPAMMAESIPLEHWTGAFPPLPPEVTAARAAATAAQPTLH